MYCVREILLFNVLYEGVSRGFRTGRLEREQQMIQLSAARCSCIAILLVSLVSFAAITLCVASKRVFIIVYFVIDSVRELLDTPSYINSKQQKDKTGLSVTSCSVFVSCHDTEDKAAYSLYYLEYS
jgi:hypothetical protein